MKRTDLFTERLKLRLIDMSDVVSVHQLHSLPETDMFNTLGIPKNISETHSVIEPWVQDNQQQEITNYTFAIEQNKGNQFIGLIALKLRSRKYNRAEVWYKLHSAYWGKGFGTEALSRILDFGFNDLKLHRIEAGCAVDNIGSSRVLEKAGMTKEGRKRQVLPLKSGWADNFEYAILETDKRMYHPHTVKTEKAV
ncbi:GNAT family N-acetyltransferase [Pontibacter silvestris]|uniref:GNAT family N-acetyltransferase n=1 Tax=Pontibacter silvestris TaxID=2305183 RepID=A0ABW4X095_9BACT|nr:GNAT family N-acetyltransferase [Pontibacter silvestris]MCC9135997.1 GNAT family N-acetyltransferase [Pontibacter silvestris]